MAVQGIDYESRCLRLEAEVERLRGDWYDYKALCDQRVKTAEVEVERLNSCLDIIERRLEEGYAPGMPWSNEEMALGIVREERAKALTGGRER